MMEYRILLVEDEELIGEMIKLNLEEEKHFVLWVKNGNDVLPELQQDKFDLIVLDVMLPGRDGFSIAKDIRQKEIGTPILMLTARSDTKSIVSGLDAGADDYLTKPFEMEEFLARVQALVRRSQGQLELPSDRHFAVGKYKVNFELREVNKNDEVITLSQKESDLLELFVRNPQKTFTRADILDEVWGMDAIPTERTVDNFIVNLRKIFEENPNEPKHFLTVRGKGYTYEP